MSARVWTAENLRAGLPSSNEGEVTGISLDISVGEKVALVGPEHGGKALLFKVLAGLRPLREGRLEILGHEIVAAPWWVDWDQILPSEVRRKMGTLFEREGLLSNVTVREGLELLFRFKNGDSTKKHIDAARTMVEKLGVRFGITDCLDKRPNLLSGAERRLAGLARAFLSKPSVLLLENPTLGFGELTRSQLDAVMSAMFAEAGRTILVASDDLRFARRYCPRWIAVEQGRITFDGPAKGFLADPPIPLAAKIRRALEEAA